MKALLMLPLLAGCYESLGEENCAWPSSSSNFKAEQAEDHDGLAWRLVLPEEPLDSADITFYTTNESPDRDCIVALYISHEAPDPAALPALDPGQAPPDSIDGIGTLVDAVNLARSWETLPDRYDFEAHLAPARGRVFLTLVTCEDPEIAVEWFTFGEVCDVGVSEEDGALPLRRLW